LAKEIFMNGFLLDRSLDSFSLEYPVCKVLTMESFEAPHDEESFSPQHCITLGNYLSSILFPSLAESFHSIAPILSLSKATIFEFSC
jgi:hypothetical protein